MKSIKIKLIIVMLLIVAFCNNIFTQTGQRKIEGVTYVCDTVSKIIENKNNRDLRKGNMKDNCQITVDQNTPIKDRYKKAFSPKRAKELGSESIGLYCTCDSLGTIIQVRFTLSDDAFSKVSLSEIKKLEDACKGYRFKLSRLPSCAGQKYYVVGGLYCRFNNLYNDEK